jgi:ribosomal protein S18 acetylase RimI-like enzyme
MTMQIKVARLAEPQIPEASEVLARAFHDDPFMVWVTPDETKRVEGLPWSMAVWARYAHRHGEVYVTGDSVEGVAIWITPGKFPMSVLGMMRAGMFLMPLKRGPARFIRVVRAMNHLEHLHKQGVSPRHWYLLLLGVDPSRQGQGIGACLMEPVLARADAEGLPCYLESFNARNLPFYERHGFQVVVEDDLPNGGPHFWTMKREPSK